MPEPKEIPKLPKSFICSVLRRVIGEEFVKFVREKIESRNERIKADGDLTVEIDPEIAEALAKSSFVSSKYLFRGRNKTILTLLLLQDNEAPVL